MFALLLAGHPQEGALDQDLVRQTLNVILKFQEDIEAVEAELAMLTNKATKTD